MAPSSSINKNHKDTPELTPQPPSSHLDANSPRRALTFNIRCCSQTILRPTPRLSKSLRLKRARGASGWRNAAGRKTVFSYAANLIAITHLHVAFSADPLMRVHAFYNVILSKYNKGLMAWLGAGTRHTVF